MAGAPTPFNAALWAKFESKFHEMVKRKCLT